MLMKKIVTLSKVDSSGSDVYSRFEFQLACVFASFLELSKSSENFYILLDYIDDFVIVDNPNTDTESITFVQVKSQKGKPITLHTIVIKEWILKQAKNYENFADDDVKNILLTNFGISIKSKVIDSLTLTPFSNLDSDDNLKELKEQVFSKTSITSLDNFYLLKASISIDSYETELKGQMHEYANKNGLSALTIEALETIYVKIWNDLECKQRCVLSDFDKTNEEIILDKKAINYTRVRDIFRIALDIQLPREGEISDFCKENKLNIGSLSNCEFGILFRGFRVDAVKNGMTTLEECWIYLRDHKDEINYSDSLCISSSIIGLLDEYAIINSSVFYKKYKYCISTFLTYKFMKF